ncbi:MAG: 3'(2'),5'-bisphosphate nucleotidase CysQ [Oscillatoriales cyanobacterium SM2_2_1]|nr:3'(2'),5'-bisphosphate nucleotidase CysQ [Oscillatoriales cyanobacterium SM2_2_1]
MHLPAIMEAVRSLAWQVSDLLMAYFHSSQDLQISSKGPLDGDVTAADLAANQLILTTLKTQFADAPFSYRSEEDIQPPMPVGEWTWVIDPLDGTSAFIRRTSEFAVHLALTYRDRPVLSLVARPAHGELYTAIVQTGAYRETRTHPPQRLTTSSRRADAELIAITSRSHRNPELERLIAALPHGEDRQISSMGGKLVAIAAGEADYFLSVSQNSAAKDWDFCALN